MLQLRKRGKFWHARGSVPMRQPNGKIARVRIEESTHEVARTRAARVAADIAQRYHDEAYRPQAKASPSFTDAALIYTKTTQPSKHDKRFISRLIEHFGDTPIATIDQGELVNAASTLYPTWGPGSLNRAVFTPVMAIASLAGCPLKIRRPTAESAPIEIPSDEWFDAVLPHCPPKLAALIVTLTVTGRRVGELLRLTEADVDYKAGTLSIAKTKTGDPVVAPLPPLALRYLKDEAYYRRKGVGQPSKRLFGYAYLPAAHTALTLACERAGVRRYGFHAIGRHSFATRALKAGKSIKWVQVAGGWASPSVPMNRYLHLEQSEVHREMLVLGQNWGKRRNGKKKLAENRHK